jgi:hypothetical protein
MNKFNVGDRVWTPILGWGKIAEYINYVDYPFLFISDTDVYLRFTKDGKYSISSPFPILFHDEVKDWPNPPKPLDWSKVAVDTLVLVRDKPNQTWLKRYFSEYKNNMFYCWDGGKTSHTTQEKICWSECSLTEPKE